jgi:alkylation response protein AidB-like acyl-CoA dehydrogenase
MFAVACSCDLALLPPEHIPSVAVYSSAQPVVREMDEAQKMRDDVIKGCFEQGLMGIEIPAKYGGAGTWFACPPLFCF